MFGPINLTYSMKKIYYLATCDTCKRIIEDLNLKKKGFNFQDIKTEAITAEQLEDMREKAGSYEALFSKIARKYRALGLNERKLTENEMKHYILEEYTFLKRPVILINSKIYIGNSKSTISSAKIDLK